MLDNDKLNRRLNRIFKELKQKWGIVSYRIAVESRIPHASLSYMKRGKFEWKLNHLLAIVDFLNRYGVKTSLPDLLDFSEMKSFDKIFNTEKADFRIAKSDKKRGRRKFSEKKATKPEKPIVKEIKPIDFKLEADSLIREIAEVVKDNRLYKKNKIAVGLKINGKGFNIQKEIKF